MSLAAPKKRRATRQATPRFAGLRGVSILPTSDLAPLAVAGLLRPGLIGQRSQPTGARLPQIGPSWLFHNLHRNQKKTSEDRKTAFPFLPFFPTLLMMRTTLTPVRSLGGGTANAVRNKRRTNILRIAYRMWAKMAKSSSSIGSVVGRCELRAELWQSVLHERGCASGVCLTLSRWRRMLK